MSLLKQILETHLVKEAPVEGADQLVAATPQNQHKTSFSLLQNIHGNEITTGDVINHLKTVDDAEEEVDTVAFGLETTDGQIVKVYVNAEEAEAFEDKMSQLLGKIDDIDQAIEELSNEFDVVRVVKPDDMESDQNEIDPNSPEVDIQNRLDEPLTDDDIVTDIEDDDMVADPDADDESKDKKDDKKNDKPEGDEEDNKEDDNEEPEEDGDTDGLSFDDESETGAEDDADAESEDEDKDKDAEDEESEDDPDKDKDAEDEESEDDTDEDDPDEDPKKQKTKKDKKPAKDKESKMKEEGLSMLKQLVSLNEAKKHSKEKHVVKVEPPKAPKQEKPKSEPQKDDTSADIFHLSLTKEEEELEKIFANPIQQLIFRVILLLGVNADQINIRKFKVRKSVKEVSTLVQHHPQIKNILSKLGKDLASKKSEIHKITEAEEDDKQLTGTIKDQLSTDISKKIYNLILALGIPEFLLTYKKTAFRNRIKNLSKIAVKHTRIKSYIYLLCDLLKVSNRSEIKEGWEAALMTIAQEEQASAAPVYKFNSILEDFSKTADYADLGTFSVMSMGEVGGTTLKVKDFSLEFGEEQFEKFVALLGAGKSGVIKSENLGKVNVISHGKEYVIKKIKPDANDKYPFGVLVSKKSIDKILG